MKTKKIKELPQEIEFKPKMPKYMRILKSTERIKNGDYWLSGIMDGPVFTFHRVSIPSIGKIAKYDGFNYYRKIA